MSKVLDKMKQAIGRRQEDIRQQDVVSNVCTDTLEDKIDALSARVQMFQSTFRAEDDQLLLTIFEAQADWYELTKDLRKEIVRLNERLAEMERVLWDKEILKRS
jgi:uncharacterized protein (UPF0305 family)